MTHLEHLTEMLTNAGVEFTTVKSPDGKATVDIAAGDGPQNQGYSGFFCEFRFSESGNLDSVATWE